MLFNSVISTVAAAAAIFATTVTAAPTSASAFVARAVNPADATDSCYHDVQNSSDGINQKLNSSGGVVSIQLALGLAKDLGDIVAAINKLAANNQIALSATVDPTVVANSCNKYNNLLNLLTNLVVQINAGAKADAAAALSTAKKDVATASATVTAQLNNALVKVQALVGTGAGAAATAAAGTSGGIINLLSNAKITLNINVGNLNNACSCNTCGGK